MTFQSQPQAPSDREAEHSAPRLLEISHAPVSSLPNFLEALDFKLYLNHDGSHLLKVVRVDTYPLLEPVEKRIHTQSYPIKGTISPFVDFYQLCGEARQRVLAMSETLDEISKKMALELTHNDSSDLGDLTGKTI